MEKLSFNLAKMLTNIEDSAPVINDDFLFDIEIIPKFEIAKIHSSKNSLWRYRKFIPIKSDENIISVDEGFTPLAEIEFDGKKILIKQEQLFSSGSYKDRGASVLMSKVKEMGIKEVVEDSSGNAGCAIAMYSALAKIKCEIFVPEKTLEAKLFQMKSYGAIVHKIHGTREDVTDAALNASKNCFYASHSRNPFFFQGTKTFAYEICEQMNWKAPDSIVIPVGNGTLLIGCFIGFSELLNSGIISKMPKLIGVQAENCSPLFYAFQKINDVNETRKYLPTIAEGIAIAKPMREQQILQMVKEANGNFITVTENEIIDSLKLCGQKGFYIEPTSAACIAGLRKYLKISENENVVSLFSGHGLKSGKIVD